MTYFWTKMLIAAVIGICCSMMILSSSGKKDKQWINENIPDAWWISGDPHGWPIFWSVVAPIACVGIAFYLIP